MLNDFNLLKDAAKIHSQLMNFAEKVIQKGEIKYAHFHEIIEEKLKSIFHIHNQKFSQENHLYGLEYGWAFPLGISVNGVVAHDSCNPNDERSIFVGDMVKIDIGVHILGNIIDSARTFICGREAINQEMELILATKDATLSICDNVREGTEINSLYTFASSLENQVFKIKPVSYLNGHSIELYNIHAGQLIPYVQKEENEGRIQNGCYAIETFSTNGKSKCKYGEKCNHYQMIPHSHPRFGLKCERDVYKWLCKNRKFSENVFMPFSSLWIYQQFGPRGILGLDGCVRKGLVMKHEPLIDIGATLTSQHEHTIYVEGENCIILN